jgi:NADH-quinone oxidoreductase subunit L
MLGLTLSNNFLEMFIFWELVGVCSYLLIGFWYKKPEAASAAKKAFLVTRVGDIMFLVGVIMIFQNYHTFNFTELQEMGHFDDIQILTMATLLLFGGAVGKSAQFPLHVWLPDAMEGPTTVSALIHAATMVKAGVFLVARAYFMIEQCPDTLATIAWIGAITAFMAATMAIVAYDIKRVLAYSTISQLGYMFIALGCGGYTAGMFHLMNHAFFKALLFLCSGSVIHAVGTNDMRLMGGLHGKMKITSTTMLIGALSISGIPFVMSGFWSKDEVLATAFHADSVPFHYGVFFLASAAAIITAFYMFRLWFMTFAGKKGEASKHAHESPKSMTIPLIILAILAFGSGFVGTPLKPMFQENIFFHHVHHVEIEPIVLGVSLMAFFVGFGVAYYIYYMKAVSPKNIVKGSAMSRVRTLLVEKYYMDHMFIGFAEKVFYSFCLLAERFDQIVIDGIVNGIAWVSTNAGKVLRKLQTGIVHHYAILVVIGIILLMLITFGANMWELLMETMGGT